MAKLVFHIGHPKTGTTALQTVLNGNGQALGAAGVLYPTKARPTTHHDKHALAKPWLTGLESAPLIRASGCRGEALRRMSESYWSALKAEVQSTPHRTLVLSCESFWAVPIPQRPSFRARLSEICDHATVVAYLRSPASRFLSKMNQNVRMLHGFRIPSAEYYRPVIEAYRAEGFEDIVLSPFERARLAGGDVVTDFCRRHLPSDLPPLDRGTAERSNESISNEALAILDEVARRYPVAPRDVRDHRRVQASDLLRSADKELGGNRRPSLRPEVAGALVARCTDLHWLRDDAGITFEDVDYDRVGAAGGVDLARLGRVEDFCSIDADRLLALRALTDREIARIFGAGPVRRVLRRLSVAFAR